MLICILVRDEIHDPIILVASLASLPCLARHFVARAVIKSKLCTGRNIIFGKKGQFVDIWIVVIERDGKLNAIGIAGMVDEASRPSHVHTVTNIRILLAEFIESKKVVWRVDAKLTSAFVCFFIRDDFPPVSIDELALPQGIFASKS